MNYPDAMTMRAYDAAQGRDETPEPDADDCYDAARDLLHAIDRGFISLSFHTGSSYVSALRDAVAAEAARRATDEAELRAACERLRILGRVG